MNNPLDFLSYASYAANRGYRPDIQPADWARIFPEWEKYESLYQWKKTEIRVRGGSINPLGVEEDQEENESALDYAARMAMRIILARKNFYFFLTENGLKSWSYWGGFVKQEAA